MLGDDQGRFGEHTERGHAASPNFFVAAAIQSESGTCPLVAWSMSSAVSLDGKRTPVAYRLIDACVVLACSASSAWLLPFASRYRARAAA